MEKQELLNFLLNNISCFEGVTLDDFCLLNSLESDELGLMSDSAIKVTPLLKQISDYALIATVLDENDLGELATCIDEENNVLDDIIKIVEICYEYISILKSDNCNHPSVLTTADLVNGLTAYGQINENICDLVEIAEDSFQDTLLDLSIPTIDKLLDNIEDNIFKKVITQIKNVANKEELLLSLSNYSKTYLSIIMLNTEYNNVQQTNKNNLFYINNNYFHFLSNEKFIPKFNLTSLDVINSLATIIQRTEEYEEEYFYKIDDEEKEIINKLKESYILYKSYKYKFLKDTYKEQKLLQKCKKM